MWFKNLHIKARTRMGRSEKENWQTTQRGDLQDDWQSEHCLRRTCPADWHYQKQTRRGISFLNSHDNEKFIFKFIFKFVFIVLGSSRIHGRVESLGRWMFCNFDVGSKAWIFGAIRIQRFIGTGQTYRSSRAGSQVHELLWIRISSLEICRYPVLQKIVQCLWRHWWVTFLQEKKL